MTTADGLRHMLHWGGMVTAVFLAVLLPANGFMRWDGLGRAILLILALSYFQAGVHLDRALLWIGLLMGGLRVRAARARVCVDGRRVGVRGRAHSCGASGRSPE